MSTTPLPPGGHFALSAWAITSCQMATSCLLDTLEWHGGPIAGERTARVARARLMQAGRNDRAAGIGIRTLYKPDERLSSAGRLTSPRRCTTTRSSLCVSPLHALHFAFAHPYTAFIPCTLRHMLIWPRCVLSCTSMR